MLDFNLLLTCAGLAVLAFLFVWLIRGLSKDDKKTVEEVDAVRKKEIHKKTDLDFTDVRYEFETPVPPLKKEIHHKKEETPEDVIKEPIFHDPIIDTKNLDLDLTEKPVQKPKKPRKPRQTTKKPKKSNS